jgi:hypothetical protein
MDNFKYTSLKKIHQLLASQYFTYFSLTFPLFKQKPVDTTPEEASLEHCILLKSCLNFEYMTVMIMMMIIIVVERISNN